MGRSCLRKGFRDWGPAWLGGVWGGQGLFGGVRAPSRGAPGLGAGFESPQGASGWGARGRAHVGPGRAGALRGRGEGGGLARGWLAVGARPAPGPKDLAQGSGRAGLG